MTTLDKYCVLLKKKLINTKKVSEEDVIGFKLKSRDLNFYTEMSYETSKQYSEGGGNELADGKMNMIRSSSAMIYNLLGNGDVKIIDNKVLPKGLYTKEFEKRYKTVNVKAFGRQVEANLDAWLYNSDSEIFIESKCLEWIENSHEKKLKESYVKDIKKYFYTETAELFRTVGLEIPASQYDSCQMFKHTLAIYNYLKDKNITNKKIFLVNVVWEPNMDELPSDIQENYQCQVKLEHKEFTDFYETMKPLIETISSDTHNAFDIKYLSVKDFCSMLEYSNKEQETFLQRYL